MLTFAAAAVLMMHGTLNHHAHMNTGYMTGLDCVALQLAEQSDICHQLRVEVAAVTESVGSPFERWVRRLHMKHVGPASLDM